MWSLFAAIGLFAVGAGVSITHGVQELLDPEPATDFVVAYAVLALSAVLEGVSFLQSVRQARRGARVFDRDLLTHVARTSDPTVRAVFFEDAGALVGIVIATAGIALHQVTGSAVPDALGSILVGVLLGLIAYFLIRRNMDFLVGEAADPAARDDVLRALLAAPDVARVTFLHLQVMGAGKVLVVGAVDLVGEETETEVAHRLAGLEAGLRRHPEVVGAVLSLSEPDEPALSPQAPGR